MLGKRKPQRELFDVGNVFPLELPTGSFHAQLAAVAPTLFQDADFADLYKAERGRPSVPPSRLALLLLLQYQAGVSDEEAVARSAYDLRWAAVLGRPAGQPLCARTTLLLFRSRLVLNGAMERLFDRSLQHARAAGLLKNHPLHVVLDTRPLVGRGAVEDTYNLIARAMDRLLRELAQQAGQEPNAWAEAHDLTPYLRRREASLQGSTAIDWSNARERQAFLTTLVGEARRLLALAEPVLAALGAAADREVRAEYELLTQILAQDVTEREREDGPPRVELREGTAKDRRPSATDPDQRHGHKSASKKFTGHKARVAVERESPLITDIEALAGNAPDAQAALAQVEAVETRTGPAVASTTGDGAFGAGTTRQAFADAARVLHAKVPAPAVRPGEIGKQRFTLHWEGDQVVAVTCPNNRTTRDGKPQKDGGQLFTFAPEGCQRCPLRFNCRTGKAARTISIHPQEALLAAAREFQASADGAAWLRERVVVEHTLARLARLGIGQARYVGLKKTRFQLLVTAAVVNFRWTWNWQARREAAGSSGPRLGTGSGPWERLIRVLARWWERIPPPPSCAWVQAPGGRTLFPTRCTTPF